MIRHGIQHWGLLTPFDAPSHSVSCPQSNVFKVQANWFAVAPGFNLHAARG